MLYFAAVPPHLYTPQIGRHMCYIGPCAAGEVSTATTHFDVIAFNGRAYSWSAMYRRRHTLIESSQRPMSGRQAGARPASPKRPMSGLAHKIAKARASQPQMLSVDGSAGSPDAAGRHTSPAGFSSDSEGYSSGEASGPESPNASPARRRKRRDIFLQPAVQEKLEDAQVRVRNMPMCCQQNARMLLLQRCKRYLHDGIAVLNELTGLTPTAAFPRSPLPPAVLRAQLARSQQGHTPLQAVLCKRPSCTTGPSSALPLTLHVPFPLPPAVLRAQLARALRLHHAADVL